MLWKQTWYVTLVFDSKSAHLQLANGEGGGEGRGQEGRENYCDTKKETSDFFISTISFKGYWNGRLAFQFEKFLQILLESEMEADMVAAKLSQTKYQRVDFI